MGDKLDKLTVAALALFRRSFRMLINGVAPIPNPTRSKTS